jgi:uncharacterized protein
VTEVSKPLEPGSIVAQDATHGGCPARSSPTRRFHVSPSLLIDSRRLGLLLPVICLLAVGATLLVAPEAERPTVVWASLVAVGAGLAATAIGVYGGIMVPGLLLLGVDARFVAALTLFLQILVIPLGAGTHHKMGNFTRAIAAPLIVGGVAGAFLGPFFAALLPKEAVARVVAGLIVLIGIVVLATLRLRGLGEVRADGDAPAGRIAAIGGVAGFSSGLAGAGWGPIGINLLILLRIDPRQAIGSSLMARVFMASAAVLAYVVSASAFRNVTPDWWIVVPLFAGSLAPMVAGASALTRLGRERATIIITLLSIALSVPTLVFGT